MSKNDAKPAGFVFRHSWVESTAILGDEDFGRLVRGIDDYFVTGDVPNWDGAMQMAFAFVKSSIDSDLATYTERCERNRRNRKHGKTDSPVVTSGTSGDENDQSSPVDINKSKRKEIKVKESKSKGREIKVNEIKDKEERSLKHKDRDLVDYQSIVDAYNSTCGGTLPRVKEISDARKRKIRQAIERHGVDQLYKAFDLARESDFLSGRSGRWSGCGFDWILTDSNLIKVLEGNYDNDRGGSKGSSYMDRIDHRLDVADAWRDKYGDADASTGGGSA